MPTDPPKAAVIDSSFDEIVIYTTASVFTGCIAFGPPIGSQSVSTPGEEYRFRFSPQPGITVSEWQRGRWQYLSRVLLNEQDVRRFLKLIQPSAKNSSGPALHSVPRVELRRQGAVVKTYPIPVHYSSTADADERDLTYLGIYTGSTLSLSRIHHQACEARERGLAQIRYTSKPRRQTIAYRERRASENSAWENIYALEALIQVPGYSEVSKRFTIEVARLQEDKYGVALVGTLTPKRSGVLDTIEWHCPLRGGDGRQFLNLLEPVVRQVEKDQWLLRWKKAERSREVLARVRTRTAELVLWEGGRELPITRRQAG